MTATTLTQNDPDKDKEITKRTTLRVQLPLLRKVRLAAARHDITQQEMWFEAMRRHLQYLSGKRQLSVVDQQRPQQVAKNQ